MAEATFWGPWRRKLAQAQTVSAREAAQNENQPRRMHECGKGLQGALFHVMGRPRMMSTELAERGKRPDSSQI